MQGPSLEGGALACKAAAPPPFHESRTSNKKKIPEDEDDESDRAAKFMGKGYSNFGFLERVEEALGKSLRRPSSGHDRDSRSKARRCSQRLRGWLL